MSCPGVLNKCRLQCQAVGIGSDLPGSQSSQTSILSVLESIESSCRGKHYQQMLCTLCLVIDWIICKSNRAPRCRSKCCTRKIHRLLRLDEESDPTSFLAVASAFHMNPAKASLLDK